VQNPSFRGSITVPEGSTANIAFWQLRDGYLVQPLPFKIELKDFRIEHYETGQPKSFESDLVITAPGEPPLTTTIAVNHPLIYKGYAIYQSSFKRRRYRLQLSAWSLGRAQIDKQDVKSAVFERLKVETPQGPVTLEWMISVCSTSIPRKRCGKNVSAITGRISLSRYQSEGEAAEYETTWRRSNSRGRPYYLSGVRARCRSRSSTCMWRSKGC